MSSNPVKPFDRWTWPQQGIIFFLSFFLVALGAWRGGFGRSPASPPDIPEKIYFIEVQGAVPRPGIYSFTHPPNWDEVRPLAARPGPPSEGKQALVSGSSISFGADGSAHIGRMTGAQLMVLGLALDLNQAPAEDLQAIPGIGPALARRIITYREMHGPFAQVDDLLKVKGMGEKSLVKIQLYLAIRSDSSEVDD
jgi:competence protein ComEA